MFLSLIMLAGGLILLIHAARWLIDGSSSIAKRFGIPAIVIGLTIVSLGTTMPELVVNLIASFSGEPRLAVGNITGSLITNFLLVLGVAAVITPLHVKSDTVWKEIPFAALAAGLVWILASDVFLSGGSADVLSRGDGFVLLAFLVIFLYYAFGVGRIVGKKPEIEGRKLHVSILLIAAGAVGLAIGGYLTVEGASRFAALLGVSETIIGLTIVALGTSLPELATAITAARRGNADIAVGNVVGANILNVFWILGLSAVLKPLPFTRNNLMDALMALSCAILLFISTHVGRKGIVELWQGWAFIALYVAYMAFRVSIG